MAISKEARDRFVKANTFQSTPELLDERGQEYEQAMPTWKAVSIILTQIEVSWPSAFIAIRRSPYYHNWFQIFGKLMRALSTPHKEDHWRDIAGYATLCANDIVENTPVKEAG